MSVQRLKDVESGVSQSYPARSETTFQESEILHIWVINNFSLCSKKTGEYIRSETFASKQNVDKNKWCMELYPNGITSINSATQITATPLTFSFSPPSSVNTVNQPGVNQSSDFLSLYLRLVSFRESQVSVKYKLSIINEKEEIVTCAFGDEVVKVGCAIKTGERFIGKEELMKRKQELLPSDKLTLMCEVSTLSHSTGAFVGECATLRISECRIHHDIGCLLENQEFSDVTIVVSNGREFRAHKAILGARSPVFAAMFKNEMSENRKNKVEIADMEDDVLKEILRFIYTGTAENLDKIAADLLVAADKYELNGLQNICAKSLSESITIKNAADYLVLADMHHKEDLKLTAIDFILGHFEEVKTSEGWMLMRKNHPQLIFEFFLFKPDS